SHIIAYSCPCGDPYRFIASLNELCDRARIANEFAAQLDIIIWYVQNASLVQEAPAFEAAGQRICDKRNHMTRFIAREQLATLFITAPRTGPPVHLYCHIDR